MKGSFIAVAIAAALLSAACSEPISPTGPSSVRPASPGAPAAAAQSLPFKGRLEGSQTLTPLQPPFGAVSGSADGTATHLGRFTVVFPHTVNFATRTGVGTYTFTAADGDTLTAAFTGQAQGGPVVSIEEHATITGGTGRFAGATGTFVVLRDFDQTTGRTEGSFEGTISSVGAGQQ